MTRRELIESLTSATLPVYGTREATAIARLVAEKRYGLSRADIALDPDAGIDPGDGFAAMLADLAAARPVQYVLGRADFDGLELAVGEGVLIPRPETEELVRWIITNYQLPITNGLREKETPHVLDLGTGSGAIAIALAKRLPEASVTAVDISPEALRYARLNNEKYQAGVTFRNADILDIEQFSIFNFQFSIIVSNPPYIPSSERRQMAANVVGYEPDEALFVPDHDHLLFYRRIAKFARRGLAPEGALYFEIHEKAAAEVVELLENEGFSEIELREDINLKPRMVRCRP